MRVRREFQLLAAETASAAPSEPFSLRMLTQILKEDPAYREYMLWMGIFGGGTLMLTAQLVLVFSEQLHLKSALQIALLAVVPLLTQPLFLPWWARLFDGSHVVRLRSRQGWAIVGERAMCPGVRLTAAAVGGARCLGAAQAGANLGWSSATSRLPGRAQHYMGARDAHRGARRPRPPAGVLGVHGARSVAERCRTFALLVPLR
jgi:hypothetical protein